MGMMSTNTFRVGQTNPRPHCVSLCQSGVGLKPKNELYPKQKRGGNLEISPHLIAGFQAPPENCWPNDMRYV